MLDFSELEQNIACHQNELEAQQALEAALIRPDFEPTDLLRLVMIYSLRYENSPTNKLPQYIDKLGERGVDGEQLKVTCILI